MKNLDILARFALIAASGALGALLWKLGPIRFVALAYVGAVAVAVVVVLARLAEGEDP
jgi:hypothetical protein